MSSFFVGKQSFLKNISFSKNKRSACGKTVQPQVGRGGTNTYWNAIYIKQIYCISPIAIRVANYIDCLLHCYWIAYWIASGLPIGLLLGSHQQTTCHTAHNIRRGVFGGSGAPLEHNMPQESRHGFVLPVFDRQSAIGNRQ